MHYPFGKDSPGTVGKKRIAYTVDKVWPTQKKNNGWFSSRPSPPDSALLMGMWDSLVFPEEFDLYKQRGGG